MNKIIIFSSADKKRYSDCLKLRNDVLRTPLGHCIYDENLEIEKNNCFYGLVYKNELIATLSTYPLTENSVQLTAFAVSTKHQRKGYGKQLFSYVLEMLRKQGVSEVLCDARETAIGFYEQLGFLKIKEEDFNDKLNITTYKMRLIIK